MKSGRCRTHCWPMKLQSITLTGHGEVRQDGNDGKPPLPALTAVACRKPAATLHRLRLMLVSRARITLTTWPIGFSAFTSLHHLTTSRACASERVSAPPSPPNSFTPLTDLVRYRSTL
jgi:hypothetical protein